MPPEWRNGGDWWHCDRLVRVLVLLFPALLISSCVYGPTSLNVRVCNLTPEAIRVVNSGGETAGRVQVVNPGGMALAYAPEVTVHGPKATTRVAAGPLEKMTEGSGYRYAHFVMRGMGRNDVVFDVTIDEAGKVWARTTDGRRTEFPAAVVSGGGGG